MNEGRGALSEHRAAQTSSPGMLSRRAFLSLFAQGRAGAKTGGPSSAFRRDRSMKICRLSTGTSPAGLPFRAWVIGMSHRRDPLGQLASSSHSHFPSRELQGASPSWPCSVPFWGWGWVHLCREPVHALCTNSSGQLPGVWWGGNGVWTARIPRSRSLLG